MLCLVALEEGVVAVGATTIHVLLHHCLIFCVEFYAIEGPHPVLVVPRELLHDFLLFLDFIVDHLSQIALDHDDQAQQVVGVVTNLRPVSLELLLQPCLVLSQLLWAAAQQFFNLHVLLSWHLRCQWQLGGPWWAEWS